MEPPDFESDWALLRRKQCELDPGTAETCLIQLDQIGRWIKAGENDKVRELARDLEKQRKHADGEYGLMLYIVWYTATNIPFLMDDPEFEDEPPMLQSWRTVESGFTVMDRRTCADPTHRNHPRHEPDWNSLSWRQHEREQAEREAENNEAPDRSGAEASLAGVEPEGLVSHVDQAGILPRGRDKG